MGRGVYKVFRMLYWYRFRIGGKFKQGNKIRKNTEGSSVV